MRSCVQVYLSLRRQFYHSNGLIETTFFTSCLIRNGLWAVGPYCLKFFYYYVICIHILIIIIVRYANEEPRDFDFIGYISAASKREGQLVVDSKRTSEMCCF